MSDFHCTIHQKSKNKRKWLFETTAVFKDGELKKKKKHYKAKASAERVNGPFVELHP